MNWVVFTILAAFFQNLRTSLQKKLNKDLGTTFLFSTHDEKVMGYLDRIIHLRDGCIEKDKKLK